MEGEQVNVDYGNWEKKAAESVTKKLESTREMPVQQVARTITLVLENFAFLSFFLYWGFDGVSARMDHCTPYQVESGAKSRPVEKFLKSNKKESRTKTKLRAGGGDLMFEEMKREADEVRDVHPPEVLGG